jgi:tRNA modification GTPase
LERLLGRELQDEENDSGEDIVPNLRQKGLMEKCQERLKAAAERLERDKAGELGSIELAEAVGHLDRLLGRWEDPDVMDQVFKRFCIGK